jgi:molybdate transport system substrate-binding protein
MTSLKILSGGAAQGLIASLAPTFKEQTGLAIEGEFGAVGAMAGKLREGWPADIVVLTAALVADLARNSSSALRCRTSAGSKPPSPSAPAIRLL